MPLPQSAIDARARREERKNNRPRIKTSRYANAERDSDIIQSPTGERLDRPTTTLDAYKSDLADQAFKAEKKRARQTQGRASSLDSTRFNTIS